MKQNEREEFLIKYLLNERREYRNIAVPDGENDRRTLLRSLMNVRTAAPVSDEFLRIQDEYLTEENRLKGVVKLSDLTPAEPDIYMWKGDITRLGVGAVVNAANSGMTGCYQPCHNCIDNCIHTFAGVQLRSCCDEIMRKQGFEEPTGTAKITPAFNLPCDYVIHTVGPIVSGKLNDRHRSLLESCYRSCLEIADKNSVESIAFCCISTGVFMFPNVEAAEIAVSTVKKYKAETGSGIKVIFNVFKKTDEQIYGELLGKSE
jgi:O-acetyl-ADP-ribose deacetylase (regulator of RNase III)